ncbi:unnamed protein product [Brassica rapa]|uniref:CTLH domain-containing protein n=2 Tax=Brassica TaxID=3705 RepID=M4CU71_BRACM|nr:unnamed protein product [Brassica napus]CAG7866107.1 unnamed protein product [Brassica rapa]CAG7874148.1 unnamed protein product [Brassica rapa]VDC63129.1 unnamed protein product [Brassica rapa]VDC69924.1 unnamed protein product [Brassica rapa]
MAVRKAVQNGNVEDAIEKVNDLNFEILDRNPELFFHLQQQRVIELIRQEKPWSLLRRNFHHVAAREKHDCCGLC